MNKNNKNIKIAAATGMTLFSLVAVFSAAIAWFAAENSTVTATGMKILVENNTTSFVSVEVHKCIPDQCTDETLAFSSNAAVTMTEGTLPSETLIVDDYGDLNKSQPVLLLFNLKAGTQLKNVKVTSKANSTSSWLPTITSTNCNSYPLSNAVYFRSAAFSRTGTGFQFGTIAVADLTQESEFATLDGETWSYDKNITVFQGADSSTTITHVAVVLDYYLPAVQAVQDFASTSPIIVNPSNANYNYNRLGFSCDWSMYIS